MDDLTKQKIDLQIELLNIIQQVKKLKDRAMEIQEKLKEKDD